MPWRGTGRPGSWALPLLLRVLVSQRTAQASRGESMDLVAKPDSDSKVISEYNEKDYVKIKTIVKINQRLRKVEWTPELEITDLNHYSHILNYIMS